jgi:hypothetical protein
VRRKSKAAKQPRTGSVSAISIDGFNTSTAASRSWANSDIVYVVVFSN